MFLNFNKNIKKHFYIYEWKDCACTLVLIPYSTVSLILPISNIASTVV